MIELLVTVGIFVVITTIVLVQHSRFSGNLLLGNLAYDLALSIRQAQVYGLSVREFSPGTGEFTDAYGVYFDADTPETYILFADRNGDEQYTDTTEIVEVFTIRRGNFISLFCATPSAGGELCSDGAISRIDILFQRPNPDALLKTNLPGQSYSRVSVTVQSPDGRERTVSVASTGQISVEQQ